MKEPFPPSFVDVSFLGLKSFSRLFDTLFGFPRASLFFFLFVRSALDNLSMEGVCDREFESSDRLFYYLGRMSVEEVAGYCNTMLRRTFKLLWKNRALHRPVLVAIDTTDITYDGRDSMYVHHKVKRRGVKYTEVKVLRFISMSIVSRRFKLTLAVRPVKRNEKQEHMVEELLKLLPGELKVRAVLMDKGFYYTGIFKVMEKYRLKYVVPVKRYPEMGVWYRLCEIVDHWRFRYTMHRERKAKTYQINVYLEDQGIEDYIGYASNLDMEARDFRTLVDAYRYRWNIENGYKEAKDYRIKTNSRNHAYRVLAYAFSHLMMNLHMITKKKNKTRITADQMQMIFETILDDEHGIKRLTKKMTILY